MSVVLIVGLQCMLAASHVAQCSLVNHDEYADGTDHYITPDRHGKHNYIDLGCIHCH